MKHTVKDCEGRVIELGDKVEHILAEHVRHWPKTGTLNDWEMEDGYERLSMPFTGKRTVQHRVSTACVELNFVAKFEVPIFLGHFLRVV